MSPALVASGHLGTHLTTTPRRPGNTVRAAARSAGGLEVVVTDLTTGDGWTASVEHLTHMIDQREVRR